MDIGCVGGLICYEYHMTLAKAAMAMLGEEIHCAVWPGWWSLDRHLGGKRQDAGSPDCDILPAIREYALETQTFVISCSWYLPESEIPDDLKEEMRYNLAAGGSCIVSPAGLFIKEPVFEQETIVWAELDLSERRVAKAYFDALGHYARWNVFQLHVDRRPLEPANRREGKISPPVDYSAARIQELAERYEIAVAKIESLLNALEFNRKVGK